MAEEVEVACMPKVMEEELVLVVSDSGRSATR